MSRYFPLRESREGNRGTHTPLPRIYTCICMRIIKRERAKCVCVPFCALKRDEETALWRSLCALGAPLYGKSFCLLSTISFTVLILLFALILYTYICILLPQTTPPSVIYYSSLFFSLYAHVIRVFLLAYARSNLQTPHSIQLYSSFFFFFFFNSLLVFYFILFIYPVCLSLSLCSFTIYSSLTLLFSLFHFSISYFPTIRRLSSDIFLYIYFFFQFHYTTDATAATFVVVQVTLSCS